MIPYCRNGYHSVGESSRVYASFVDIEVLLYGVSPWEEFSAFHYILKRVSDSKIVENFFSSSCHTTGSLS